MGKIATPELCWSCNQALTIDLYVWVNNGQVVPCCPKCWGEMTVEQRLRVGQMFADRADGGWVEAVTTVFRSALGRFVEERGGDQWFRGRGN